MAGSTLADRSMQFVERDGEGPNVWLFVGVNGVGKTTTIGKLAAQQRADVRGHEGEVVHFALEATSGRRIRLRAHATPRELVRACLIDAAVWCAVVVMDVL
mgnify:CR=1 FL=1